MNIKSLLFSVLLIPAALTGAFAASPVITIDNTLTEKNITRSISYLEDKDGLLTLNDIRTTPVKWQTYPEKAFNFGFNSSAYWFRLNVDNITEKPVTWYLEIAYSLLDDIRLHCPDKTGNYKEKKFGDHQPFDERDIKDRNFSFILKDNPGTRTYYIRIITTSSMNFAVIARSPRAYLDKIFEELPVFWIYYGVMIVMALYNLIIFFFVREQSYIFYSLFIVCWIGFQSTLNGLSFQYLWPNSIGWANNNISVFMSLVAVFATLFFITHLEIKKNSKIIYYIMLGTMVAPSTISIPMTFIFGVHAGIMIATGLAGAVATGLILVSLIFTLKGVREARFFLIAFTGVIFGIIMYAMKTYGILPSNFITNWSVQIGSALAVILLSLSLADRINIMRRDMSAMNINLEKSEKISSERASYLEGIVTTAGDISNSLIHISSELSELGEKFRKLSQEQAATSEEMSATFEELSASNDNIYQSTVRQREESERSKELTAILKDSQKNIAEASTAVVGHIEVISDSTNITEFTLKKMIDKMDVIDQGGRSINEFVSVIDDITESINLLSLNAAIEAARAGDHGRGFAVVADEISKLASATSDNSREIAAKISAITRDINEGKDIVNNTKDAIDVTFKMVISINEKTDDVAKMMTRQGEAIKEVFKQSHVMEKMSKEVATSTSEQNLSMEETLKTIEKLSEMAQEVGLSNQKIIDVTKEVYEKSQELDNLITDIT